MRTFPAYIAWQVCLLMFSCAGARAAPLASQASVLRWTEGLPGCTFTQGEDSTYRYGLWTDEFGALLTVDPQELEKSSRRPVPFLAVFLMIRYRGAHSFDFRRNDVSLEFVRHYHDRVPPLPPSHLGSRLRDYVDLLRRRTEAGSLKHPEKRGSLEIQLHDREQDIAHTLLFLDDHSLNDASLSPQTPEVTGWLYFGTEDKWVGDWKKHEDFVLRLRLDGRMVEFPFALPPSKGDFVLRRRPD